MTEIKLAKQGKKHEYAFKDTHPHIQVAHEYLDKDIEAERKQWQAALDKEKERADEWKQNAKNLKSQCGSRWKDQKKWREKTKKAEARLKKITDEIERIAATCACSIAEEYECPMEQLTKGLRDVK